MPIMTGRVVLVTTYFRPVVGGVESNAERLARYLNAGGLSVQVLTKRVTRELPDKEHWEGVAVERIGPFGDRSSSGKWQVAPFVAAWLIRRRATYDVVSCIDYRGVGLAALAARSVTGRPVLLQAQTAGVLSGDNADAALGRWGIGPDGPVARIVKRSIRSVYGRADAIACIGREIEREALACGVPREKVHYLPNAIDMAEFRPPADGEVETLRRRFDLPVDRTVCLFVGRLSREKGLMDLLEAWRLLQPTPAILVVAGPDMARHPWNVGPMARDFVQLHGLGSTTRFLGSVSDVATLLRVADIVVQPSYFEAQGLSAIEALASGVPVVASAVGGLLDFVVDKQNGLLSPSQDPVTLADRLRALMNDAALRRKLAAAARASVVDAYDERAVFARFAALLRQLAGASA
jgi:glycosyltransferase involved in cell wall biosynthesis